MKKDIKIDKIEVDKLSELIVSLLEQNTQDDIQSTDEIVNPRMLIDLKAFNLQKDLFQELPLHGPTGKLYAATNDAPSPSGSLTDFKVITSDVEVFPSKPVSTGITTEAIQDLISMFGLSNQTELIRLLFDSLAVDVINKETQDFLDTNSQVVSNLVLDSSILNNAQLTVFAIVKKVGELVQLQNQGRFITRGQYCLMPPKYQGQFEYISLFNGCQTGPNEETNIIQRSSSIRFVYNPNPNQDSIYVGLYGLNNSSQSQGVYSPHVTEVIETQDYESGNLNYHIFNRFQLSVNPLHDIQNRPLMWKFDIEE